MDRSFVSGLGVNADDSSIVRSVIELAHAFGVDAVAEGIETPEQLAALQGLGAATVRATCGARAGQPLPWARRSRRASPAGDARSSDPSSVSRCSRNAGTSTDTAIRQLGSGCLARVSRSAMATPRVRSVAVSTGRRPRAR